MGWNIAGVFISKPEDGLLGSFPAHQADRARQVLGELGWEADGQSQASQFDAGLGPPSGWFCVGAYDGAVLISGHPDLYGLVEASEKRVVQHCLSLLPDAQVLFWELSEGTGYIAYALYQGDNLQRAFVCDPDRGAIVNQGSLQPEEKQVLPNGSPEEGKHPEEMTIDWCDVAEPLLFAMTAKFLGAPLNKFAAEKLATEMFKQRRSWSKR